jgi:hypothetical protein
MPLFGRDGIIEFRRELPSPAVIPASYVNRTNKSFLLYNDSFWTGEPVILVGSVAGVQATFTGFYGKDTLDNAALYTTIQGACNADPAARISLSTLQVKPVVLAVNNHPCQTLEILKFYNSVVLANSLSITDELTLADWPEREDAYYAAGPKFAEWKITASIRGWNLNTSAPAVDTSSIGTRFSEAIKSAVSGSGSLDFIIELFGSATEYSPDAILRTALLTERGALGNARFYLAKENTDDDADPCKGTKDNRSPIRTSIYYNANILFTDAAVDMSADGLAQGSADFVTTGPIRIAAETEKPVAYSCDGGSGTYDFWSYISSTRSLDKRGGSQSTFYNSDGELFSTYSYDSAVQFRREAIIVEKFTQFGTLAWHRIYTGSVTNDFYDHPWPGGILIEDHEGYPWLIFTRAIAATTGAVKAYVAKLNPADGSVVDSFCFKVDADVSSTSVSSSAAPSSVCMDSDRNFYFGFTYGTAGPSNYRSFLVKVTQAGTFVWSRQTNTQVNVIGGLGPGNTSINSIVAMKIRGSTLYVQYNFAALQKFDLNGNMLSPWTQYEIQTDMTSSGRVNATARNFRFDSNGNIYAAYQQNGVIAKYDQNLQPLWAYYLEEISLGDDFYPAGQELTASGIDLTIDDQDRIFLSTSRYAASSLAASSAQGFLEISTDGAFVSGRTFPRSSASVLSTAPYFFAEQRENSFDGAYIPVFQTSAHNCYGYLQKNGQVGAWAIQPPPAGYSTFTINQPNFARSFSLGHGVYNQLYNKWTAYSPGHELVPETVVSSPVSGLGFSFSYRSQTGVIAT